jgi:Family of unknown function (DUF6505)
VAEGTEAARARTGVTARLPRTIRLDGSDVSVFEHAAEPGEWAVPGSFAFLDGDVVMGAPTGRRRAAFASGFLGVSSFGWSTLVMVTDASPETVEGIVEALAAHFLECHGAPSPEEARSVARREVGFAASLCDHPPGTLLTVSRRFDGDELIEQFKTIVPHDDDPLGHHAPFDLVALAALGRADG